MSLESSIMSPVANARLTSPIIRFPPFRFSPDGLTGGNVNLLAFQPFRNHRLPLFAAAIVLGCLHATAFSVAANAANGWTPTKAAATIKANYITVDPNRLASAQHTLDQLIGAGIPETDARVIRARAAVQDALHGAHADKVTCKGTGKRHGVRYMKFHCSAHLTGMAEYTGDYSATVRLTFRPPAGIRKGWW